MVPAEVRAQLENQAQVVFRYVDARGRAVPSANPNGALRAIAGVCNAQGNVVGLMPHPERCAESLMGSTDGRRLFESVAASVLTAMAGR
jgi:phosphoribosylformylglycinamidine synthase